MKEDSQLLYTDIIIACVQLRQTVADDFFVGTFDAKLRDFINTFVQNDSCRQAVESLLELLSQFEYLKLGEPLQLLACRELLLKKKLAIVQQAEPAPEEKKSKVPPPVRFPERTKRAHQVREEILTFIRHNQQARTKDIMNQFGALSQRTIHRSLKELVDQGLVVKQADQGGAIRYLAS